MKAGIVLTAVDREILLVDRNEIRMQSKKRP
jgi:hypothetical protein